MNRAVFLDRDGTIIAEKNYLSQITEVEVLPGIPSAIRELNRNNFKVIVISNQSGVGQGKFTQKKVEKINNYLKNLLLKKGAKIDKIYFCPHIPENNCSCRKPSTGLIHEAQKDFNIVLEKSYLIGDKASDIEAGYRAGCKTILVLTGCGEKEKEKSTPTHLASNLREAVKWILKK